MGHPRVDTEIIEINVNETLMDATKDTNELRKLWFQKVEKDSENIFTSAENAVQANPKMQAVIVKRI